MKTSKQWWDEVKADPVKFNDWLLRQYRGEVSASVRVREAAVAFGGQATNEQVGHLYNIAFQEAQHARWIKDLLTARGIPADADQENAEKRYWKAVDLSFTDFVKTMAVAAHAERMRLERIEVIADDVTAPWDVREKFLMILSDEKYHAAFFAGAAGADAIKNTAADHEEGRRLLGLEA
jgi:rubrerythrin